MGSALQCVKCHTSLADIPRQKELFPGYSTAVQQKPTVKNRPNLEASDLLRVESVSRAVVRIFRGSVTISVLASLATALICWYLNKRTLYDFGNALYYATVFLAVIGWLIFSGNQKLVREQANPLNPMNRVMPGTHSERTRQYWLDFMEGTTFVSVIGVAAALCFGLGWLIVTLAKP